MLLWHVPQALEFANDAITPILVTLVYAFIAADSKAEPEGNGAISARILERVWAVIVIDFIVTLLFENGLGDLSLNTIVGSIIGTLLLFITAILTFADVCATLNDLGNAILLVPFALVRSITTAVRPRMLFRVCILFSVQLLVGIAANGVYAALYSAHVSDPTLWSIVPITALAAVPFAAVTVVLYLDA